MEQSKKCLNCETPFIATNRKKFYCSKKCVSLKKLSEKTKSKISESLKGTVYKQDGEILIIGDEWSRILNLRNEIRKNEVLSYNVNEVSFDTIRKIVIFEQDEKCGECGVSEWRGKKLSLEVDHKDGNNQNNDRANLIALCPNCHSITDTWRGRNKTNGTRKKSIPDEVLLESLLKNKFNFRQSLLEIGMAAKGGNYKRCHRLLREYNHINNNAPITDTQYLFKKTHEYSGIPITTKYCIDCSDEISYKAVRCSKCDKLTQRKAERPSLEKLSELISTNGFVQVGKLFGVSDNTIRKWIKTYGANPKDFKKTHT